MGELSAPNNSWNGLANDKESLVQGGGRDRQQREIGTPPIAKGEADKMEEFKDRGHEEERMMRVSIGGGEARLKKGKPEALVV